MKVAMATWNGRISPVFDVARQLSVFELGGQGVLDRQEVALPGAAPHEQALGVAALAPGTLICGAVSRPLAQLLAAEGITVIAFVAGTVDEVLTAWLAGNLPNQALSMPGCRCPRRRQVRALPATNRSNRKEQPMKIAITATGGSLESPLDPRFGRAKCFVVVPATGEGFSVHDNAVNLNAAQGAGVQAGEAVARLGVGAVITGHVGPKAFRLLTAAGIKVFHAEDSTVGDALRRFRAGELPEIAAATVEGHQI